MNISSKLITLCLLVLCFTFQFRASAQQQFQIEYNVGGSNFTAVQPLGNGYFVAGTVKPTNPGEKEGLLMKLAQDGSLIWGKAIGGSDDDYFNAIQVTHDGNLLLLGTSRSFVSTPADPGNIYLVLVDTNGTVLNSKSIGTPNNENGYRVQETADHGFIVVGESDSADVLSPYLIKTDAQLNVQWSRLYRNSSYSVNIARAVVELSGGGYALVGNSTMLVPAPEYRMFFLTTDATGQPLATKHFAFTDHVNYVDWGVFGEDIIQNTAGNLVIVGSSGGYYNTAFQNIYSPMLLEITPSGSVVQSNGFFLNSGDSRSMRVKQTPDGGYVLGGYQGNYYLSMFKVDANIAAEWSYFYAANFSPQARGYDVHRTPDGGYMLCGTRTSSQNMRLVKTNSQGQSGCAETVPSGAAASGPTSFAEYPSVWTARSVGDTLPTQTIIGGIPVALDVVCGIVAAPEIAAASGLEVYPNPCGDRLHVRAPNCSKITVTNVLGENVLEHNIDESGDIMLDVSGLVAGVYFVRGGGAVVRILRE